MLPTVILKHMLNTSHLESCFGGLVNFLNFYEFQRAFPDIIVYNFLSFSPSGGPYRAPYVGGAPGPRCGGWPARGATGARCVRRQPLAGLSFGWARLSASAGFLGFRLGSRLGFPALISAWLRLDFGFGLIWIWL